MPRKKLAGATMPKGVKHDVPPKVRGRFPNYRSKKSPGKPENLMDPREAGILGQRARAAKAKIEKTIKYKWTRAQTLEHMQYAQALLAENYTEFRIVAAMVDQFTRIRVDSNGRPRNPLNRKRAIILCDRVLEEWRESLTRNQKYAMAQAYNRAMRGLQMAYNGKLTVIAQGTPDEKKIYTKPSVQGYVAACEHMSKILGTDQAVKVEATLRNEPGTITELIASFDSKELQSSIVATKEKFPELFPDYVPPNPKKSA